MTNNNDYPAESFEQKMSLFFFDPQKTKDQYIEEYKKTLPGRYSSEGSHRYSPLFFLLKDIRRCFLFGREYEAIRVLGFEENYLTAAILIDLGIDNIVELFYDKPVKNVARDNFMSRFMGITDPDHLLVLANLRDALTHNFYKLSYKERNAKFTSHFMLGFYDSLISGPIRDRVRVMSRWYEINPRKMLNVFESGLRNFKEEVASKSDLADRFDKKVIIDDWMIVRNA